MLDIIFILICYSNVDYCVWKNWCLHWFLFVHLQITREQLRSCSSFQQFVCFCLFFCTFHNFGNLNWFCIGPKLYCNNLILWFVNEKLTRIKYILKNYVLDCSILNIYLFIVLIVYAVNLLECRVFSEDSCNFLWNKCIVS